MPRAAAIAETPQIEKPVATRSARPFETPSRFPAQQRSEEGRDDDHDDDEQAAPAEREHVLEHELEAQQDDADAQERPRREREPGAGSDRHADGIRDDQAEHEGGEDDRHPGQQPVDEQSCESARRGQSEARSDAPQRTRGAGPAGDGRRRHLGHLNDQVRTSIAC